MKVERTLFSFVTHINGLIFILCVFLFTINNNRQNTFLKQEVNVMVLIF